MIHVKINQIHYVFYNSIHDWLVECCDSPIFDLIMLPHLLLQEEGLLLMYFFMFLLMLDIARRQN